MLSPRALKVLEKKLYKKVNIRPQKMIRRYSFVICMIDGSTCMSMRIGSANITQIRVRMMENTIPDIMVVLICR